MAKVVTQFVSDDKDMLASIAKLNQKLDDLAAKNTQQGNQSAGLWKSTVQGILGAVAAYGTLETAISLVNKELEAKFELERKARDAQLGAAGDERDFIMNLGAVSKGEQQAAIKQLMDISRKNGVAYSQLTGPAGAALSASGGDVKIALESLEMASRIAPHSAEAMTAIAGAIIDLSKATGSADAKRGLDLLVGTQSTSHIADIQKLATNAPRGIIGAATSGFTPEGAAALFDALSVASADQTGATSATATATLAMKLRAWLPEEDLYKTEGGKKKLKRRGVGKMTGEERLFKVARQDREAFLASLEDSEMKPFFEEMLTAGSEAHENFKKLLVEKQSQQGLGEQWIGGLNNTDMQQTANLDRSGKATIERALMGQTGNARYALVRGQVDEALEAAGFGYGMRSMTSVSMRATGFAMTPEEMGARTLEGIYRQRASGIVQSGRFSEKEEKERLDQLAPLIEIAATLRAIEQNQRAGNGSPAEEN